MTVEPIHVTDEAFEKVVMQSPLPVIVDFWAPWCGPCKMIAPIVDKLAKDFTGKLLVAKINTDENRALVDKYNIAGIPTMFFIIGGKIVHRETGVLSERKLHTIIEQLLSI